MEEHLEEKRRYVMRVAIITADTEIYRGNAEDRSGEAVKEIMEEAGFEVVFMRALPNDREVLSTVMLRLAENGLTDLVLTTGGAGCGASDGCDREADCWDSGGYARIYLTDDEARHAEQECCGDQQERTACESSGEGPGREGDA